MSTSGTTSYNLVALQIMDEAFDLCGIGAEGEAITADMYERASRSLNIIAKAWSTNEHLWLKATGSITLTEGTQSYSLATTPLRVLEVRRRITSGSIDTPLSELSRIDYFEQPNKTVKSIPVAFYYDPQVSSWTLYVWPTASAATASSMTLQYTYLRRIEDFAATNNDMDLPQEWMKPLTYALAEQLALKYGVAPDIRQELAARAAEARADLEAFDEEPASLMMMPDTRWTGEIRR